MVVVHLQHLWILLKQGDSQAFEIIYRQTYPIMYRYALRVSGNSTSADQCIQNVFVRIWERRKRLGEAKNPQAYLLASLRREILAEKQPMATLQILPETHPSFSYSPQDLKLQQEEADLCRETISCALNKLPVRQREAIYLRFYEELSVQEVAEVMEVRCQSVQNFVYRGLQAL